MAKAAKSNKQFMILSALGIIFVVDSHALSPVGYLGLFPYNAYLMAMFVFISGYFFKEAALDRLGKYLLHKCRTFLVPLFVWNLIYGLLVQTLRYFGIVCYGKSVSFRTIFVEPFLECYMFQINDPAWFVGMLFMVVCSYALLRKLLRRIWSEIVAVIVMIAVGTLCVYLARRGYNQNPWCLVAIKTGYFLQFYQLGVVYRSDLEKYVRRIPRILCLLVPILVNSTVLYFTGSIQFLSLSAMSGFLHDYYLIPFIVAVMGTLFWLTVADMLVPALENDRLVNYISGNTFSIMMHHIFWFNVLNAVLAILVKLSVLPVYFDFAEFRSTAWYRFGMDYTHNAWYVPVGVAGPLVMKYLGQKCLDKFKRVREQYKKPAETGAGTTEP